MVGISILGAPIVGLVVVTPALGAIVGMGIETLGLLVGLGVVGGATVGLGVVGAGVEMVGL